LVNDLFAVAGLKRDESLSQCKEFEVSKDQTNRFSVALLLVAFKDGNSVDRISLFVKERKDEQNQKTIDDCINELNKMKNNKDQTLLELNKRQKLIELIAGKLGV